MEPDVNSISRKITHAFTDKLEAKGAKVSTFHLAESGIPIFDFSHADVPDSVSAMNQQFRRADAHIWLTPLYHGSMTGAMKNCLDWLEISAKETCPYLTNKVIGLVCWADGAQAMQGINAMDAVAKALRAWVLPYSIPIVRGQMLPAGQNKLEGDYLSKFDILTGLLTDAIK